MSTLGRALHAPRAMTLTSANPTYGSGVGLGVWNFGCCIFGFGYGAWDVGFADCNFGSFVWEIGV